MSTEGKEKLQGRSISRAGFLKAGGALAVAVFVPGCGVIEVSGNEDYPSRELQFIVPFPAGSAPDSTSRTIAEVLEEELGQPVVVVNRPGGSGTVGLSELASAEPDGYTLGLATAAGLTMQWQLINSAFEGPDQLQIVGKITEIPTALFVGVESGIESVEDFVSRAKEEAGSIRVGIPNKGSELDIQLRLFAQRADIELENVYYDAGQQVLPVVNGTIQAGIAQPAPVLQYAERGDIRIVGVFSNEKPEGLDAPLFSEVGYDVPYVGFENVAVPDGTPEERVQRLQEAVETAIDSDRFQQYARDTFIIPAFEGPEAIEPRLEARVEENRELIEEFGLRT